MAVCEREVLVISVFQNILVSAYLSGTLHRITNGGRFPPLNDGPKALFADDSSCSLDKRCVLLGIILHVNLDNIKGSDGRMGDSTGKDSAHDALAVVRVVMRHFVAVARVPGLRREGEVHGGKRDDGWGQQQLGTYRSKATTGMKQQASSRSKNLARTKNKTGCSAFAFLDLFGHCCYPFFSNFKHDLNRDKVRN